MADSFSLKDHRLTGHNLIEASAGTGKTYTISGIFCKLLLKNIPCSKILIVTFTNLAKGELIERLHSDAYDLYLILTRKKELKESKPFFQEILKKEYFNNDEISSHVFQQLSNIDENVLTIHGFCNNVASRFFFEFGFSSQEKIIEDESDIFEKTFFQILQKKIYPTFKKEDTNSKKKKILLEYIFAFQKGFSGIKEKLLSYQKDLKFQKKEELPPLENLLQEYHEKKEQIKKNLLEKNFFSILYSFIKEFANGNKYRNFESQINHFQDFFLTEEEEFFFDSYCQKRGILFDSNQNRVYSRYTVDYFEENLKKKYKNSPLSLYFGEEKISFSDPQFLEFMDHLKSFFWLNLKIEFILEQQYKILLEESLHDLQNQIHQTKKRLSIKTHDDTLKNLLTAIENKNNFDLKKIRSQYDTILIDEFQDTDKKQIQIFDKLFIQSPIPKNIFFIGDPKQSIYSFRGADLNSYLFVKEKCKTYTLNQNWRSTPYLVNTINFWFRKETNPFLNEKIVNPKITAAKKDFVLEKKFGSSVDLLFYEKKKEKNTIEKKEKFSIATVNHILSLLSKGVQKNQIGILVRKKAQANFIIKELENHQISYALADEEDLFQTEEAKDFYQILKAIVYKDKNKSIPALATSICKSYFKEKENFNNLEEVFQYFYCLNQQQQNENLSKKWVHWKKKINTSSQKWQQENFLKAMDFFFDENLIVNLLQQKNGKQIFSNIEYLIEISRKQIVDKNLTKRGLLNWFQKQLSDNKDFSKQKYSLQRLQQDDAIQIMTIHKSKGLEFDFVYCPFFWDQKSRAQGDSFLLEDGYYLSLNEKEKKVMKEKYEQLQKEEDCRLRYVMLTRAKKKMIWGIDYDNYFSSYDKKKEVKEIIKKINENYQTDFSLYLLSELLEKKTKSVQNHFEKKTISKIEIIDNPLFFKKKYNRIVSFSSLMSQLQGENSKWALGEFDEGVENLESSYYPKGSLVGTMIHEILEKINFENLDSLDNLIENSFDKYDFEQLDFQQFIKEKINILTNKKIIENISLAKVKNTLRELEFHFKINHQNLFDHLTEEKNIYIETKKLIKPLKIDSSTHFLNGIIDFVFEFENRYFIIDWKTNDLKEDYQKKNLEKEMVNHFYILQYHLYTLALDEYLSLNVKNYDYEKNFGGVFYIFLRGIKEQNQEGIFFDRVPFSFIEKNRNRKFF